ncbi:hypothetical protein B0I35DRAFT_482952 [Stachybotrys elegans]|uniref:NWD NACHT-NTPase N-terminal domain-containing protein n=1 Tax=Stachybotrys elegans TaxID=80388 RepID=A0A8K0SHI1_9HYPO|nr:hypothetical protein B0I35DRAFT_482952 [Stachybotrys elegans]
MGISKFFQRSKGSHYGSSNADKQGTRDNRSGPTPTRLTEASSSVVAVSRNSPSLPAQTSPPTSRLLRATESPVPATPGTSSPTVRPTTPLSQITPLSEDVPSLWNRAYEALRDEDPQLVDRYEKLLSRELEEHPNSIVAPQNMQPRGDDLDYTKNRMDYNCDKRQSQLKTITDRGLHRADEKQIKYTLFGHGFVLKEQVAQAAQFIQAMKNLVDEAIKVSPEASLAWAGVCVLLPLLTNPSAAEEANRDGLSYVTFRIRYYIELERLLWPENLVEPGLKVEFDGHIVDLYQRILEFQFKTVLRFYRRWIATASRDVIRYDDWNGILSKIKEQEQIVREESSTLNTIASQKTLEGINVAACQQYNAIQSLLSIAKDHLNVSIEHRDISAEQLAELKLQSQILDSRPLDLPIVHEARYDGLDINDSPRCENGTRIHIQERIRHWVDNDSDEPFFWLVGPAGTGKSTIARS